MGLEQALGVSLCSVLEAGEGPEGPDITGATYGPEIGVGAWKLEPTKD